MKRMPTAAAILLFLAVPLSAFAAPTVSFTAQPSALFADQAGSWTVTVRNPDPAAISNASLILTLPAGFTVTNSGGGTDTLGPPHQLVWTGLNIPASGGSVSKTFSAKPDCSVSSGTRMQAQFSYGSPAQTANALSNSLSISFLVVSLRAEKTSLNVAEQGSWTFRVTNNTSTAATGRTIVANLPVGFSVASSSPAGASVAPGSPSTITWTGQTINANSYKDFSFTASPDCGAASGQKMSLYAHCPGTLLNSSAITVLPLPTISIQSQSPALSVGETGTWTFRMTNPNSLSAPNRTIVASVPEGFRIVSASPIGAAVAPGSPSTITWTNQTINASTYLDFSFTAIPGCAATSGQTMSIYAQCPSNSQNSLAVSIKRPSPSISLSAGGSAQPIIHKGDTLVWSIVAQNGGPGDLLSGLALTETLGSGYSFVSLKDEAGNAVSYTGSWSTGAQWNTGTIAADAAKTYFLTVIATGCTGWINSVTGSWTDGQTLCGTVSSSSSAQFIKNLPDIGITAVWPAALDYCGYPNNGNTVTVEVANGPAGAGPANDFFLNLMGLPSDWGVKNINVITGGSGSVAWDSANKRFSLGSLTQTGGARDTVKFSFTTGPTGSACPPATSASLSLWPAYVDECGVAGLPPVIGPKILPVDTSGLPSASVTLSGPRFAQASQSPLDYVITGTYSAPVASPSQTFNLVYSYPAEFTVVNAGGGVVDSVNRRITWEGALAVTLAPSGSITKTVQMQAPGACQAGSDAAFSASMTAVSPISTCLGCSLTLSASGSASTYTDNYSGPLASSSKTLTYYNSMKAALDSGLSTGEVCTDNRYTAAYTFVSGAGAPAAWSDTDGVSGHNISYKDLMILGQSFVSIDDVTVNGTSYPGWPAGSNIGAGLDLGYLDAAGAPKPNTGAALVIKFTLRSGQTPGSGVDFGRFTVPGFPPSACSTKDYYETGQTVAFTESSATVATVSPSVIDASEVKQFRITLNGGFWPLYDPVLMLDTMGGYELVGAVGDITYPIVFNNFVTITGASVPAFAPTQSGTRYVWSFASDMRTRVNDTSSGAASYITFYMRKACDTTATDWKATFDYNTRCSDNSSARTKSASSTSRPELIRKASLDVQLQPSSISAYDKYPSFRIVIWNRGSGTAYNTRLLIDNGASLNYKNHSVPTGAAPDSQAGASGDNTVTFVYNSIPAGDKRYLDVKDALSGNSDLSVALVTTWGGSPPCETITKNTSVALPPTQVVISAHSVDHPTDYCGNSSRFTVKAKNVGTTYAYNLAVSDILPPGFSYIGNETYSISSGALTGNPTTATSGSPATGVTAQWNFSSVLPLDSAGDRSLAPGAEISIQYDAKIADCAGAQAYSAGDKKAKASAAFDPPYNAAAGGAINSSATSILTTYAAKPQVTIKLESRNLSDGQAFTTGLVLGDQGETIEWRITLSSVGDYLATNVRLVATIPSNVAYVSGSTQQNGNPISWIPSGPGSPLALGNMTPGQSHVITFRATVASAALADTSTNADAIWGCLGSCPGTTPVTETTVPATAVDLRTRPVVTVTVALDSYPLTGSTDFRTDGGKLRITIKNAGTKLLLQSGDYLSLLPPVGYNFNPSTAAGYPPVISSTATHTGLSASPSYIANAPSGGAQGELRWDNSKIDYIDQNETITLRVCFEADGYYLDSACAGYGPASDPPLIPTSSVAPTLSYHNANTAGDPSQHTSTAAALSVNPRQANLDIVSFVPATPIILPGDTAKAFTITIKNLGDAPANNVAKVAGSINQPWVFSYGPGFMIAAASDIASSAGGTISPPDNVSRQFTITNIANGKFNAGASQTITITVTIVPGRPASEYWIDAETRGTAMQDSTNPAAAASVSGSLCYAYSDDYQRVEAGYAVLVLRPNNSGSGKPGSEIIYNHTLRNNGLFSDIIYLSATNSLGWTSLFYKLDANGQITGGPITQVTLGVAGSGTDVADFAVRVFIPANAALNSVNVTTVKATLKSDSQEFRTATDTTTVLAPSLVMKKLTRNVTNAGSFSNSSEGKPGEIVEYQISFSNYSVSEIRDIVLSDPIPPFSTLVANAYTSGASNYALRLIFNFSNSAPVPIYANSDLSHAPVFVLFNALCLDPALSAKFPDGVFRLQAGESGELYYQVTIQQ